MNNSLPKNIVEQLLKSIKENDDIDNHYQQDKRTDALSRDKQQQTQQKQQVRSESEEFLVKQCSKDMATFTSVMLSKHVRKPFCDLHYQLFQLLMGMVEDHFYPSKEVEETPS